MNSLTFDEVVEAAISSYANYPKHVIERSRYTAMLLPVKGSSFVYIAEADESDAGTFKVGRSVNPEMRMKSLKRQWGNFRLIKAKKFRRADVIERGLHRMLSEYQVRNEIFHAPISVWREVIEFLSPDALVRNSMSVLLPSCREIKGERELEVSVVMPENCSPYRAKYIAIDALDRLYGFSKFSNLAIKPKQLYLPES